MSNYDGMTDAEALKIIMRNHQCGMQEARFILAIERGQITGDIVVVDENGKEVQEPLGPGLLE